MRLLLDTHIVLWWFGNSTKLTAKARSMIREHEIFVSAVTPWEISIKKSMGGLKAPDDFLLMMERHAFRPLPIDIDHALAVETLPRLHRDPFDRMLVTQAQAEGMKFLTHDKRLIAYGSFVMVV